MIKKSKIIDLTKILKPYAKKKLWVALNSNYTKVGGYGSTPGEAFQKARENKIENPILIQALSNYSGFIT
ncbi:MAG: hypothetical protein KJ770_02475 [Actinobacteria bacterium]|nr:hypothetical protein [Actinomycetota bacterium]